MGLEGSAVMEAMERRYGDGGEGRMREECGKERKKGRLRWKENREDGESKKGKMEIRRNRLERLSLWWVKIKHPSHYSELF